MNTAAASLPPAKSAAQIALITQSRRWLAPVLAQTLKAWLTGADEAPQGQVEGDDAGGTPAAAKARQRALPPEQLRQTQALLAALLDSATAVTQATPAACPPLFWAEILASAMQPVQAAEQWRQTGGRLFPADPLFKKRAPSDAAPTTSAATSASTAHQ